MPLTIFVHVRPKSCVRKMYGEKSSSSGFFTAMYAVPASNIDASIWLTRPRSGMSFGVTFVHVLPPSRVTWTSAVVRSGPDDVDVRLARARARTPWRTSPGLFMSCVIGPPDSCHRLRIVAREIAADLVPGLAAVRRLPHVLRRGVEHVRIDRREDDRVGPLPAFDQRAGRFAGEEARIRRPLRAARRCGD